MIQQTLPEIPISESVILRQILTYLRLKKIFCWRQNTTGVYDSKAGTYRTRSYGSLKGVSDILGVHRGRALAIEVKSAKGRLSPEQTEFLRIFTESGGIAFVARSIEDVEKSLAEHGLL